MTMNTLKALAVAAVSHVCAFAARDYKGWAVLAAGLGGLLVGGLLF